MYIQRHLEKQVLEASKHFPVVMVCGQRQVGKSTMLHHIKESERRYVTLNNMNARRLAETDPELFFEIYDAPLLIDEFQRVPSILLEMKRIVDQKAMDGQDNKGMFWLTGSQKFRMMKNISESLAGRVAIFDLSGLSASELEQRPAKVFDPEISVLRTRLGSACRKDIHQIYQEIFQGGLPVPRTESVDRDVYFTEYITTYLERDIHDLKQVGKLREFHMFLSMMAARTGQELNYEQIARSIGVSSPTIKEWVSILETFGVIYLLSSYHPNMNKRLIKRPKVYFMDTGLAAYLCNWPTPETLEGGPMSGAFFETYVVSEIVKSYYNAGKPVNLYYYRDIDQREIDLLILKGNRIYPIEIKKGCQPSGADRNFSALEQFDLEVQPGVILCMNDELIPYNRTSWYCPISVI